MMTRMPGAVIAAAVSPTPAASQLRNTARRDTGLQLAIAAA
jgi:hypothetical protein